VEKFGNSIQPEDVFVIGDTPLDVDAGIRAGFNTVGVATGGFTAGQLSAAGATFVIEDFLQNRDYFLRSTLLG
jgi:phosphoglycolate phosphatase